MIGLNVELTNSDSDSQLKRSVKSLARQLMATFDLLLSFFDSKSSQLKLDIQKILVEAAFDRFLFRTWLFRFCEKKQIVLANLYTSLAVDELTELALLTPGGYLSFISGFFSKHDPMSHVAAECMFNADMENFLFDKLYAKQMDRYELFEESNVSFLCL